MGRYELSPVGQVSIPLVDAHEYIANISSPVNDFVRREMEHNLTLFNSRMSSSIEDEP